MFKKCEFFLASSVENTNNEIKKIFKKKQDLDFMSLHADKQISGRGRKQNKWISKEGDFTCSYLINKSFDMSMLGQLNIVFSISIFECLKKYYSEINFTLKWPNDIFINDKKIGGVLIETNIKNGLIMYLIVGVGINFVSSPKIVKYRTTKISDFSKKLNTKKFFYCISENIKKNLVFWNNKGFSFFKKKWLLNCKDINREISIKVGKKYFSGTLRDLDDSASLILKTKNNNTIKVSYGEII